VEKMKLRLAHIGENNIKVDVRYGVTKRPLERPRCRWEDTIKMDLQGNLEGGVDWIHVSCCSS
jgi:hypothetical protein